MKNKTIAKYTCRTLNCFAVVLFLSVGAVAQNSNPAGDTVMRFQCGDALKIITFPDSGFLHNTIHIIDSDGYCDLPIIGFTKVATRTTMELEKLLIDNYTTYLPRLSLVVRPLIRVSLLGGFYRPGLYWVDPRESIWSIVGKAGGTQRDDGIQKIRWVRDSKILSKNVVSLYQSGASLYSFNFKSGDQLLVTPKPKLEFSEVFRNDVVPVFSLLISVASVYVMYETYSRR